MKTFKELYHARIAWNQQSNIPSVEEAQIVELSKKDYDHAQKIINDPKTKGGNYGQAIKDLEKWKKGSTKDKKLLRCSTKLITNKFMDMMIILMERKRMNQ
jgi:hypothetical protein